MEFLSRPETVTEIEQQAWRKIASDIIFLQDPEIDITPETATEISREIQRQMLETPMSQSSLEESVKQTIRNSFEKLGIDDVKLEFDPREIKSLAEINSLAITNDLGTYESWGFTPKLAVRNGSEGLNCLGKAILLGSELRSEGHDVQMAITADHPYIIIQKEGRTYLLGYDKTPCDITDYLPRDGSRIMTLPRHIADKQKPNIIYIEDFDKAVLHETLENIAVLEHIANNKDLYTLPGTNDEGSKIAESNKDTLTLIDWKRLQAKILPEMKSAFQNKVWTDEIERMQEIRDADYRARFFENAMSDISTRSLYVTQGDILSLRDSGLAKAFCDFVISDMQPPEGVDPKMIEFGTKLKEGLKKEPPRMRDQLAKKIQKNLGIS